MYAQVTDNTITDTARHPRNLVRQDDGSKPLWCEYITADELAACGWFPVSDERPTAAANEVVERRDVILVAGVPTVEYVVRPKTAEELAAEVAAEADQADRNAARQAVQNLTAYINATSPTQAQTVAVVKLLCRVAVRLIRDQYGR